MHTESIPHTDTIAAGPPSNGDRLAPFQHRTTASNPFLELAAHLEQRQGALLDCWRRAVERDRRLAVVSRLGRSEFEDNIPISLGLLTRKLREQTLPLSEPDANTPNDYWAARSQRLFAQTHGYHRWHEGFDLRQLMLEIGYLNQALIKEIDGYQALHPGAPHEVMTRARHFASELLDASYMHSATEFHRLQESEAEQIALGLRAALNQVELLQKQQGQILREAVHDLRGNLTVIQGATSLLTAVVGREGESDLQETVFGLLEHGTKSLGDMLTDLLDLARLEAGKEEPKYADVDVAVLMRELCEANRAAAEEKGLSLRHNGISRLVVRTDAIMVRRIAQNLLLNAVRYTRKGQVTVTWSQSGESCWQLGVEDTGPGLAANAVNQAVLNVVTSGGDLTGRGGQVANIAVPHEAAPTQWNAGEGVGLAIVRRLCSLLDAQIEVGTVMGQGTKFRISFGS